MNILCVIPARGGSKGLKDKNILSLSGKPLIGYTIEAALASRLINKIVVSTDDKKIAKIASRYNIEVIKRPREYSTDSSPIEDALRHAVRYLKNNCGYNPEIVVWLQANVPIRKEGQIDKVVRKLLSTPVDSVITIYAADQHPQWMKIINRNGFLSPLFPNEKNYRRQDLRATYLSDGAVAAIKCRTLMESEGKKGAHLFMGKKIIGVIQDKIYSLEVDSKEDLELVVFYLGKYRYHQ